MRESFLYESNVRNTPTLEDDVKSNVPGGRYRPLVGGDITRDVPGKRGCPFVGGDISP